MTNIKKAREGGYLNPTTPEPEKKKGGWGKKVYVFLICLGTIATILVFLFGDNILGRIKTPNLSGNPVDTNKVVFETRPMANEIIAEIGISPISIDEVFSVLEDKLLTELQKSEFRKKHKGRIVRWSGYVSSVSPRYDEGFFVVFLPESQKKETFPDLVVSVFPQTAKTDLVDLDENDWVEIQGCLSFSDIGTVSLDESKLIKRKKILRKIEE